MLGVIPTELLQAAPLGRRAPGSRTRCRHRHRFHGGCRGRVRGVEVSHAMLQLEKGTSVVHEVGCNKFIPRLN